MGRRAAEDFFGVAVFKEEAAAFHDFVAGSHSGNNEYVLSEMEAGKAAPI